METHLTLRDRALHGVIGALSGVVAYHAWELASEIWQKSGAGRSQSSDGAVKNHLSESIEQSSSRKRPSPALSHWFG